MVDLHVMHVKGSAEFLIFLQKSWMALNPAIDGHCPPPADDPRRSPASPAGTQRTA
jgi:hypothetical protein